MSHRWTMQELDESTDNEILRILVSERIAKLANHYTPLTLRLKKVRERLDRRVEREQLAKSRAEQRAIARSN